MDSLMNHLNSKIDTPQGVMFIFRLEDGKLIQNIKDFQPGDECVVSSTLKVDRRIQYGQISGPPSPTKRGASLQRSQGSSREHVIRGSYTGGVNRSPPNQAKSKPLTFTIINNTMRSLQDKMIINPQTEQSFEQLLGDMGEVVNMLDNPATGLYSAVPPYNKVRTHIHITQCRHVFLMFLQYNSLFYPFRLKVFPTYDMNFSSKRLTASMLLAWKVLPRRSDRRRRLFVNRPRPLMTTWIITKNRLTTRPTENRRHPGRRSEGSGNRQRNPNRNRKIRRPIKMATATTEIKTALSMTDQNPGIVAM